MKKLFLLLTLIVCSTGFGQSDSFNLVFDVTSSNPKAHETTIRHLNFMLENEPNSKMDIVIYSGSLDMVVDNSSTVREEILKLSKNENVTFKVCSTTMKRNNVDESMIISGVEIVKNPLREIFNRQQEGWGYIKETNN